jgi:hypothetical protein
MQLTNNQIRIISLLLVLHYIVLAWLFHRNGYEHTERLFYAEKLKLLFEYKENTLLTLGTTFPTTVFLVNVLFSPFGYLFAPIASTIVIMSFLFYFMAVDIRDSALPGKTMFFCLLLLFVFHPQFIFSAVSGRNIAAIMLSFYLLFRSLFNYYRSQTTYYLSLASIYLATLIFSEINFLWLVLSFLPFVVLVSLEGIKVAKDEPVVFQYYQALNNRSLRRKLVNRTVALYLVLYLLPLGAIYLFRTLNESHAGDPTYFLSSQYANWRVTGTASITKILEQGSQGNLMKQTQIVFPLFTIFLAPLFIAALLFFKGKLYELFTILTPLIFFSIVLIDAQYYLTTEYFIIVIVMAFVALSYTGQVRFTKRISSAILLGSTVLTILGGIYYFKETSDFEEKDFYAVLTSPSEWIKPKKASEVKIIAEYISSVVSSKRPILIDDAAAYPIVAHLPTLEGLVMPMQQNFVTVIENPVLSVEFICVAKRVNRLHNFTALNAYNLNIMTERLELKPSRVFETENWIIYSIR